MGEVNKKSLKGGDGDGVIGVCGVSGSRVELGLGDSNKGGSYRGDSYKGDSYKGDSYKGE